MLSSHTPEAQTVADGCLTEVNISTNLTFGNMLFGCLRQVGCLIEVTANTGLTVHVDNYSRHISRIKKKHLYLVSKDD